MHKRAQLIFGQVLDENHRLLSEQQMQMHLGPHSLIFLGVCFLEAAIDHIYGYL